MEDQPVATMLDILKEPMAIGDVFAKSGMFSDVKTQAQAVVKILAGKEMGLTPFESMNNIYIVNNKLAVMSNAMASIVKKGGKYDYKVVKLDNEECVLKFFRMNGEAKELGESTFTFKDAAKAGLVNKDVWKNYPRNMLFSRALSNGVRWFCPDAACGYTVEELEEIAPIKTHKTIELNADGKVSEALDG
jgi:hypothetical protein